MTKKQTIIIFVASILIFWLLGFYLGRKMIDKEPPKTEVTYVKGEKITDSIPYPEPYYVVKPVDTANVIKQCVKDGIYTELFPEKVITEYIEITKDDTTAIMRDWATKRFYSEEIFDIDTVGKCTIDASVQYNRLSLLSYSFIPVEKVVTIHENKVRFFSPYIGIGVIVENNLNNYVGLMPSMTAGFFIKEKYGVNIQYMRSIKTQNNFYGASLLYKF